MATDGDKRKMKRIVTSVWAYLYRNTEDAFNAKNEQDFDWYSDGLQCLFRCLNNEPLKITPRVKPL